MWLFKLHSFNLIIGRQGEIDAHLLSLFPVFVLSLFRLFVQSQNHLTKFEYLFPSDE